MRAMCEVLLALPKLYARAFVSENSGDLAEVLGVSIVCLLIPVSCAHSITIASITPLFVEKGRYGPRFVWITASASRLGM